MSLARHDACTPAEREAVIALDKLGASIRHIMTTLDRSNHFVIRILVLAGRRVRPSWMDEPVEEPEAEEFDPTAEDRAFQRAMLRAVKRGREHPPSLKIFRDRRPLVGVVFSPVPRVSGMSSAAEMCADQGAATLGAF